jgi:hypothetical protein
MMQYLRKQGQAMLIHLALTLILRYLRNLPKSLGMWSEYAFTLGYGLLVTGQLVQRVLSYTVQ